MSNKQEALWCPLCDCPSDECVQPEPEEIVDDRLETGEEIIYMLESHCGHWITLAERARDEALSNLEQTEITPLPQRNR